MATNPKAVQEPETEEPTKKRMRSPAYPYIDLEHALARAKAFYDREGRNSAPITVAATHWGYEAKSSGATQTVAALMSFGLMQDEGTGNKRKVKLTQNALKILLDARLDSTEKQTLVKQAALAPRIHQQIWAKWGSMGISNENLRHALVFEWQPPFNENTVDGFIKEFRDTIKFAKLTESDKLASEVEDNGTEAGKKKLPDVGDYVQWKSQGVHQFIDPKRVRGFSGDGYFAFVEGSSTGLPIEELEVQAPSPAISLPPKTKNMQEFVVPLSEGTRAVFQWPTTLTKEDIDDLKDSLKILERKIIRSLATEETES